MKPAISVNWKHSVAVIAMLSICGLEFPLFAQTHYVDATIGDDAASGRSWEEAFQSFVRGLDAARQVAETGGTARLNLAEGTYTTAAAAIDFPVVLVGAYPRGGGLRDRSSYTSTLDAQAERSVLIFNRGSSGSIVDGIAITGSETQAIELNDLVVVRNCVIHDNQGIGVVATGGRIERNIVLRNEQGGIRAIIPDVGVPCNPDLWWIEIASNYIANSNAVGILASDQCLAFGDPSVVDVRHNRILATGWIATQATAGIRIIGGPVVFNNEVIGTEGTGVLIEPVVGEFGVQLPGPGGFDFSTISGSLETAVQVDSSEDLTPFHVRSSLLWSNAGGDIDSLPPDNAISHTLSEAPLPGTGNISGTDPLLVPGPNSQSYLSQLAAGQGADSPAVDAGGMTAEEAGLAFRTTRTDGVRDSGVVDLGFHAEPESFTLYRSRDPQALLAHIPDISLPVADPGAAAQGPRDLLFYEVDLDDEILVRRRDTDVEVRFRYQEYDP